LQEYVAAPGFALRLDFDNLRLTEAMQCLPGKSASGKVLAQ